MVDFGILFDVIHLPQFLHLQLCSYHHNRFQNVLSFRKKLQLYLQPHSPCATVAIAVATSFLSLQKGVGLQDVFMGEICQGIVLWTGLFTQLDIFKVHVLTRSNTCLFVEEYSIVQTQDFIYLLIICGVFSVFLSLGSSKIGVQ